MRGHSHVARCPLLQRGRRRLFDYVGTVDFTDARRNVVRNAEKAYETFNFRPFIQSSKINTMLQM